MRVEVAVIVVVLLPVLGVAVPLVLGVLLRRIGVIMIVIVIRSVLRVIMIVIVPLTRLGLGGDLPCEIEIDARAGVDDGACEARCLHRAVDEGLKSRPVHDQHIGLPERQQVRGRGIEVVRRAAAREEPGQLDVLAADLGCEVGQLGRGGDDAQLSVRVRSISGGRRAAREGEARGADQGDSGE